MATYLLLSLLLLALDQGIHCQENRQQVLQITLKTRRLPSLDVCGQSSEKVFEKKIINGEPAELGAYPWMAAIGYTLGSQGPYWNCGATLITDQYVLTAAHCLHPALITKKAPFKVAVVRLGDLDLDDAVTDKATPKTYKVDKVVIHREYDNNKKINDVGLIKLKEKVQFTETISPICLPPPDFAKNTFAHFYGVITGWGKTSNEFDEETPTALQEAEVEIQELDECRRNVTKRLRSVVLDNKVICASSPGKDSCQGDSGGPLMLFRPHRKQRRMFLLGVVSYGYKCAEEGYPGVYMRVSEYMAWIIENLDI